MEVSKFLESHFSNEVRISKHHRGNAAQVPHVNGAICLCPLGERQVRFGGATQVREITYMLTAVGGEL